MKALLFAAGKGTRLKPFTDHHPKALALVNGVPLLERNIRYLQSYGINDFVINIHHFGEQIVDFLKNHDNFGSKIEISDEKQTLLETGGGLLFAAHFLDKEADFLVMNADILTTMNVPNLVNYHKKNKALATLAVSDRNSSRKLLFDETFTLNGWRNKATGEEKRVKNDLSLTEFAFSGIHCMSSTIFKKITRSGAFSIMEAYLDLMENNSIKGYLHDDLLIDVGRPSSVIEAEIHFK